MLDAEIGRFCSGLWRWQDGDVKSAPRLQSDVLETQMTA